MLSIRLISIRSNRVRSKYVHQDTVQDVVPFALERQVCFALAVTNRAELAVYRPLKPLGLTTRSIW